MNALIVMPLHTYSEFSLEGKSVVTICIFPVRGSEEERGTGFAMNRMLYIGLYTGTLEKQA